MKFHLPKKLLMAVLAAMAIHTTQAGYYTIGGVIGVDEKGNAITGRIAPGDIPEAEQYSSSDERTRWCKPIVKDGEGTLTIDEDGSRYQSLYIREGELVIKSHFTANLYHYDKLPGAHHTTVWDETEYKEKLDGMMHLSVAGKDAVMIIDGDGGTQKTFNEGGNNVGEYSASYVSDAVEYGSHMNIGGVNGNGKLILQNNACFSNWGGWSTHIGYSGELDETDYKKLGARNVHATTATTEGEYENIDDRYMGNYTQGSCDSSQYFGKGEVYVTDNSYIHFGGGNPGYDGGLYMGEAVLTIDDKSKGVAGTSYFGMFAGALTQVNITNNSTLELTKSLFTGVDKEDTLVENARIEINVDNSEFRVTNGVYLSYNEFGPLVDKKCENSHNNSTITELNLTNGATAKFGSLTAGSENGKSTAEISIDATSTLTSDAGMTINSAQIWNEGTIKAETVTVNKNSLISLSGSNAKLEATTVTLNEGAAISLDAGASNSIEADVTANNGSSIILNNGGMMNVKGTLTLSAATMFVLNGEGYAAGDTLATAEKVIAEAGEGSVTLSSGYGTYIISGDKVMLSSFFNQHYADTFTVSNWGIATASRAFVNAIRGQRTNTGCIAGGKGTAWAAVLGGNHDIDGSDINLKGAAVGADVKVGAASSVGIAVGYIEGKVKPSGLRDVDQDGTYVALYGEHGLAKLSPTSCLSLDWVAAYGNTESDVDGMDWEQDSLQLNTRLNWNRKVTNRLCMSVFGGLEYFASESDTVEEVKTGSIQNLRGELGVGVRYVACGTPAAAASYDEKGATVTAARSGCEKLVLHGEVRYMNDLVRSNPVIRMQGLSGDGENPGRQGMGIEAGATYRIGERWSASANYGYNMMNDSREHRVNVGASYTF